MLKFVLAIMKLTNVTVVATYVTEFLFHVFLDAIGDVSVAMDIFVIIMVNVPEESCFA